MEVVKEICGELEDAHPVYPGRKSDGTFKKGFIANPNGLKGYKLVVHKKAYENAEAAMEQIIYLMHHGTKDDKVRLAAAMFVVEKSFGKFLHESEQMSSQYTTAEGAKELVKLLERTLQLEGNVNEEERSSEQQSGEGTCQEESCKEGSQEEVPTSGDA